MGYSLLAGKEDLKEKVTKLKAESCEEQCTEKKCKKTMEEAMTAVLRFATDCGSLQSSGAGRKYEGVQRGGATFLEEL